MVAFCKIFIETKAKKLFEGKKFLTLSKITLIEILSSDKLQIPELEIFLLVIEWGKHQLMDQKKEVSVEIYFSEEILKTNESDKIQEFPEMDVVYISENKLEETNSEILKTRISQLYDYTKDPDFCEKLKTFLSDVLESIRFPLLTPYEIFKYVEPSLVVSDDLLIEAYRSHALNNRNDFLLNPRLKIREGTLYYVSGVCEDTPIDMLKGWKLVYRKPYSEKTLESDIDKCIKWKRILVAARARNAPKLSLLAMGRAAKIIQDTVENETIEENGTFWYKWKNNAFGFSDTNKIQLGSADLLDGKFKLSWHITGKGGYRIGDLKNLNDSNTFEKLIFASDL